ncbi:hypothetical protein ES708_18404 [subsurface metagenome]
MDIPNIFTTQLPLLSARARGAWKKLKIFQVIKGKQVIREYSEYDGSAKGHLIKFQSKWAAAVWNWQQMPQTKRRFYISRAAKLGLRTTGFNYFISLYMRDKLEEYPMYPDPHHLSHEKSGADEISIEGLQGEAADEQNAGKIKGVPVPAPGVDDDEKALTYDHDTEEFKYTKGLTAAANIGDHKVVRGNGGAKEVQESTILVSDDGEMTNPSQPAFNAELDTTQQNKTGDDTIYDITGAFWTEIFDQGNGFTDGIFTAPVTGKYLFTSNIMLANLKASHIEAILHLVTSNRIYHIYDLNPAPIQAYEYLLIPGSIIVDMDINDTAFLRITVYGDTKVIDIFAYNFTYFTGALIC